MNASDRQMDMLHGPLAGKLIAFSLPLAATSILQQLFNSADVAVVGRFAGSDALAAVGANVCNVGIFVNLLVGLSVGPNVLTASLVGQGRTESVKKVVSTSILFALYAGAALMLLGFAITKPLLLAMGTPENVLSSADLYFRIYLIGIPFCMIFNFGAGLLRSIGDTRRPLYCLLFSGVVNVLLNLFFVIALKLGVAGVAIATVLSNVLSSGLILVWLIQEKGILHLQFDSWLPDSYLLKKILQIGLPAGLQGMIFSVSNAFIQTGINSFGSAATAGSSAALNFEYFTYDIAGAFAQGTVTFTSQNFGAGEEQRCRRIFWLSLAEGMGFTAILCLIFTIFNEQVILFYTTDPAVISFARTRMFHVMSFEYLTAIYEVGCGALRGRDHSLEPALLTVVGTVGFRLVWMMTVFHWIPTFAWLMNVYIASWLFTSVLVLTAYRKALKAHP